MSTTEIERLLVDKRIVEGLDFILSHLKEPIWPRRISTKATEGRQIPVYSKQEALAWYKAANFLDCRISGYPYYYYNANENVDRNRQTIDLVMIDLDLSGFRSQGALDRAKDNTLKKIHETFGTEFEPTVIWSGNGYHIYIPIEARYVLEDRPEFSKLNEEPSKHFLRFAEWYLSDGKADPDHYNSVSFGNCMLRIPGSYNSKCFPKNNNVADSSTQIRVIKQWNGSKERAPIYLLFGSFLAYLVDKNLKGIQRQRQKQFSKYSRENSSTTTTNTTTIPWIEKLLQTPIADFRKNAIFLILAPYLVNVRKLSYQESYTIIKDWLLNKCNTLERLDSVILRSKLKSDLDKAIKVGYKPIKFDSLRERNKQLYDLLLMHER